MVQWFQKRRKSRSISINTEINMSRDNNMPTEFYKQKQIIFNDFFNNFTTANIRLHKDRLNITFQSPPMMSRKLIVSFKSLNFVYISEINYKSFLWLSKRIETYINILLFKLNQRYSQLYFPLIFQGKIYYRNDCFFYSSFHLFQWNKL